MNPFKSTRRPAFCSVAFTSIACLLWAAQASAGPARSCYQAAIADAVAKVNGHPGACCP
jgi:hypothetical protein